MERMQLFSRSATTNVSVAGLDVLMATRMPRVEPNFATTPRTIDTSRWQSTSFSYLS
ncbi:Hypothetical protein, putative [Bodo saltans]|uniref:Uncharacterized protein n=1 Tax=Bodo saltans TaxID=75058 RepID=A0A0S4J4U0_BODSA|nr:Hypothetical protein, putative [Bodo saltans]|eukprot:CUG79089.1 Hypothetical protein, putative [Bodo saltans]